MDLIIDVLTNSVENGTISLTANALNEIANSLADSFDSIGSEYGCKMVTRDSGTTGSGERSICTMMVCVSADGSFSIPFASCNYTCDRSALSGGRQACCCGANASFSYQGINGNFDPGFFGKCERFDDFTSSKM
ncbi:hypothetical protein CA13_73050 [Planctomycetes bacterium CA13]|uniref:Uncharacterized protein n=1 Tax=Novipirellula herctigrandis TaxID=2527986 RepID=A0A5C5YPH4_9BACT|nr:hypothetical protein CA13_73050 [Planctomycetes bacterium CA13]